MGKSSTSSSSDPSDNKHEQKLQAVLLADTFSNAFHPITFEPHNATTTGGAADANNNAASSTGNNTNNNSAAATKNNNNNKGRERPLVLCPLNNVPLLHHTIDFLQGSGVEELFLLCSSGADALEEYIRNYAGGKANNKGGDNSVSSTSYNKSESTGTGGGGSKVIWSSKLTITTLRFTDCTNAGDALRELDRRNVIKSDPFILMQGDVVTNVDLREAMEGHKLRRKKDNAAIMTVLLQEVGGWGLDDSATALIMDDEKKEDKEDEDIAANNVDNPNCPNDDEYSPATNSKNNRLNNINNNHQLPPLRSSTDDLLLALDTTHSNRILLWDSHPHNSHSSIPTIFFTDNSSHITLTRNYLDVGIDICSPDVLARFSDEFDYRQLRSQFVANCVAEEEIGLQSRIFAYMMKRGEYAGRMGDMRRYHRVSMDLLRRWCYPLVPDNYGHHENSTGCVDECHVASYVCERHLVYRDVGLLKNNKNKTSSSRSHVGRSTQLLGPLLLGPNNSIGEQCWLQRSVLGPNCTVNDNCSIVDSHLWGNVLVEEGARLTGVILCEGAIVRKGAVVKRGCVVGKGCVIGEGVHLKEFTRITCAAEVEDDDDYSGFDDSSSSSSSSEEESSSNDESESGDDDDDGSEGSYEKVKSKEAVVDTSSPSAMEANAVDIITNHEVVGKDGLGRVYVPSPPDDYDSDDDDEEAAQAAALELMKSQSIGYDMTLIYQKWKKLQMEDEDDGFSLEGMDSDDDDNMDMDDDWATDAGGGGGAMSNMHTTNSLSHLDDDGMQITGRQKGVDVVKELRDICLEHETSSPVENLRIELNSFKFSQNATYADCCKGAMMAVMEKILEESGGDVGDITPGKLVASLKKMLSYWGKLFESICMGSEEEKGIINSLESMAISGRAAPVLGKEPAFRFVLQTLHDQEIVNEEAIFEWAAERKKEDKDSPIAVLFWQQPTQDFLEWLEDDSSSGSDDGSDSDGEESD